MLGINSAVKNVRDSSSFILQNLLHFFFKKNVCFKYIIFSCWIYFVLVKRCILFHSYYIILCSQSQILRVVVAVWTETKNFWIAETSLLSLNLTCKSAKRKLRRSPENVVSNFECVTGVMDRPSSQTFGERRNMGHECNKINLTSIWTETRNVTRVDRPTGVTQSPHLFSIACILRCCQLFGRDFIKTLTILRTKTSQIIFLLP